MNRGRAALIMVLVVIAGLVIAGVALSGDDRTPAASQSPNVIRVVFEAKYADGAKGKSAEVEYLDPEAGLKSITTPLPWRFGPFEVQNGERVYFKMSAPRRRLSAVQCTVNTDEGFYGMSYANTLSVDEPNRKLDACGVEEILDGAEE